MNDLIDFAQVVANGTLTGLVYGMIALSFVVIYRGARVVNLAQGEVLLLGGFLVWTFTLGMGLPLWVGVPLALAASAGSGLLIERVVFRPLIGQPIFSIVMASIGLMILMRGLIQVVWGANTVRFPDVLPQGSIILGPFLFNKTLLLGALITVLVVFMLQWYFNHAASGLRLAAVAEDHLTALSMGISVRRAGGIAWVLGVGLASLGAMILLSGNILGMSVAEMGFVALPVALLGGLESIRGAPIAGVMVGVGEALASFYLDQYTDGAMSQIFPYLLMISVLLIRPQGLFGWKLIERI